MPTLTSELVTALKAAMKQMTLYGCLRTGSARHEELMELIAKAEGK